MALAKDILYKDITCTYHKIICANVEFCVPIPNTDTYNKMDVTVSSYIDAAHREANVRNCLRVKTYHFFKSDADSPNNEKIEKIYKALKELDEFEGAEDV